MFEYLKLLLRVGRGEIPTAGEQMKKDFDLCYEVLQKFKDWFLEERAKNEKLHQEIIDLKLLLKK